MPGTIIDGNAVADIIDGKAVAEQLRSRIAERTATLARQSIVPGLAVVLVGEDPASQVYVGNKTKQAEAAGIRHFDHRLPASTSTAQLTSLVHELNSRRDVHGILVQLPLPPAVDSAAVLAAIDPAKDVDGFHAVNAVRRRQALRGILTPPGDRCNVHRADSADRFEVNASHESCTNDGST